MMVEPSNSKLMMNLSPYDLNIIINKNLHDDYAISFLNASFVEVEGESSGGNVIHDYFCRGILLSESFFC